MVDSVRIKVDGLQALGAKLREMGVDMTERIARGATGAAANVVKKSAQRKVPKLTGNLEKNIITKRLGKSETTATSEHIVTIRRRRTKGQLKDGTASAYYGQFVEFGTVKMTPRPFLRPAFDENVSRAIETMKSVIADRIARGK